MGCLHNSNILFKKLSSFHFLLFQKGASGNLSNTLSLKSKDDAQVNANVAGVMDTGRDESENLNLPALVPDSVLPRTSLCSPQPLFKKEGGQTNEGIDHRYLKRSPSNSFLLKRSSGSPPLFQRGARGDLKHPRDQ
jgi:hypothetical protein